MIALNALALAGVEALIDELLALCAQDP